MDIKKYITILGFTPKNGTSGVYHKIYVGQDSYSIAIDFDKQHIDYGDSIIAESKTTQNFSQPENFVVLECVDRLLSKGYKPQNITLEKTWSAGHGSSGRLDICVTRDDGTEYLLIECKTYGKEYDKELARMNKDGGQLFTYFKFSNKADVIMLYTSELQGKCIVYKNDIIKIEEDYRTGDVKDFYDKWNKLTKDNGVFDFWVKPFSFESKALTINELEDIKPHDSSFIFNRFLEILRHNVVSDKPNAFNKIFTLFLCKIYDEKINEGTDNELGFQWREGVDDDISFQLRLTDLYKEGMWEFLEKRVTDFSEDEFEQKYKNLDANLKIDILKDFKKLRLEKNNEFAIKEVYDEKSFKDNAKVVKQVVELLQKYKIRYVKKQQYLSDFFEMLLTTGLKQESGQFFTPVPIAQFIIKSLPIDTFVETKLKEGKRDEFLPYLIDYAAGSGHFLTESMHEMQRIINKIDTKKLKTDARTFVDVWRIRHFDWALQYVYGIEKDYRLVKVGKVGCYLHGDGLANVIHSDGLANFEHSDYKGKLRQADKDFRQDNKQFDIVVSNPPYSVSAFKNASREYYKDGDFELYERLTDNSSEIECLFIERTKQLLKDGGVAGVILPSSILSNGGIYSKAREVILQYFDIVAITELGSNTFMATGTNTVVLFLRRRNNYDCINLRKSVESFFTSLNEVTLNGVENPVSKYVEHVWNSIPMNDYISLLKKSPSKIVEESELFREYKKKIKAKNEKEYWNVLLQAEKEKLYYFILTYPQKVVLVKSGEKDSEKRFLGYEFSNRRGNEGIHAIDRSKTIEECTQLFDAEQFENPDKASTYIYRAFNGDFDNEIAESMRKYISHARLVDLLNFERVDFEKSISTSVKKKVRFENIWKTNAVVLLNEISDIRKGTSITKVKTKKGDIPVVAGGQNIAYYHDIANREGNVITVSASGAYAGFVNYFDAPIFASDCNTLQSKDEGTIPTKLIYYFLKSIQNGVYALQKGQAQPHVYSGDLAKIKIPLPPKDIQEKIIVEVEKIEAIERIKIDELQNLQNKISDIVNNSSGAYSKLQELTTKIGSGATPRGGESAYIESGISLIRSQNIYDSEFKEKGLAFIDNEQATKLNNVTVESNDILFNITGASVCRCCIVDSQYLPARVNQHVAIIRVNEKILPLYLQKVLVSSKIKSELLSIAENSSTREAITKNQLEEFKVPVPTLMEQQNIVAEIEKLEKQIAEAQKIIDSSAELKNAVLKKYL
ncbi:N-6 DNA methylase [Porphyromonadaceae bacterium]